jgi:hypothetical protein
MKYKSIIEIAYVLRKLFRFLIKIDSTGARKQYLTIGQNLTVKFKIDEIYSEYLK